MEIEKQVLPTAAPISIEDQVSQTKQILPAIGPSSIANAYQSAFNNNGAIIFPDNQISITPAHFGMYIYCL